MCLQARCLPIDRGTMIFGIEKGREKQTMKNTFQLRTLEVMNRGFLQIARLNGGFFLTFEISLSNTLC